ncbi:hypothetical protein NEOKW01_1448 [Nematocida sp. AWRm80]|nr:hypothetical protein NEOKW01_1448 [Nematocida sp. AWRm80]
MEELWKIGVTGIVLYGNYALFENQMTSIFWALCFDTLHREVKKRIFRIIRPLMFILSILPLAFVVFFPTVCLVLCTIELRRYLKQMLLSLDSIPGIKDPFENSMVQVIEMALGFLEINKREKLTEGLVLFKVYEKCEKYLQEILTGGKVAVKLVSQCVFFLGMTAYFRSLENNPMYYILSPLPRHWIVIESFERIVYTTAVGSIFNFIYSSVISHCLGSPLVVTAGLVSAILGVIPLAPVFVYCIPGAIYLWVSNHRVSCMVFILLAVIQTIVAGRLFGHTKILGRYLKSTSMALGVSAFGVAGSIIGPFLLSTLMIIWPTGISGTTGQQTVKATRQKSIRQTPGTILKKTS